MSPGRVLFTATVLQGHIEKFHIPYLAWWSGRGFETWVASRDERVDDRRGEAPDYCDTFIDLPFTRRPFSVGNVVAYLRLRHLFSTTDFDLVHTHTPVASVLTRLAARGARRRGTRVIYTAHGFHFCAGSSLISWLVWYTVEWLMSFFTDRLIVINGEDFHHARRFRCPVTLTHGVGFIPHRMLDTANHREADSLWPVHARPRLLSVGDVNACKNHRVIIEALTRLPEAALVVAGVGPDIATNEAYARALGVGDRVQFLGHRVDVSALMSSASYFVFPSRREGLPVALMEAMDSGLIPVASNIRGNRDLLREMPELLLDENTGEAIARRITALEDIGDAARESLRSRCREAVTGYGIDQVLPVVAGLYERELLAGQQRTRKDDD